MNIQSIKAFRRRSYGLFVDLEGGGKVGVNPKSGEILFDEGPDDGALDGVVVPAEQFGEFVFEETPQGTWKFTVVFGDDWQHLIGITTDFEAAARWAAEATLAIGGTRMTILRRTSEPVKESTVVSQAAFAGDPSFAQIELSSVRPKVRAARSSLAARI